MKILGLSAFFHDSAAALVVGDQVVAAAEEERFTREKHTGRFPKLAIAYCLKEAGIEPDELDIIAYYLDIKPNLLKALQLGLSFSKSWLATHPFFLQRLARAAMKPPAISWGYNLTRASIFPLLNWGKTVQRELGLSNKNTPVYASVPHHMAHIGGSYLISGLDDAAILIADQRGEWITTTLASGRDNQIDIHQTLTLPDSLGSLYGAITAFLGFRALSDEGKVMGLSSYGRPSYQEAFQRFLPILQDGSFKLDTSYIDFSQATSAGTFPSSLVRELGPARQDGAGIEARHEDIAKSLQNHLEDALLSMCGYLEKRTNTTHLCLGGGVALNSVANGRMAGEFPGWTKVFVPPSPGDPGAALGAAVWIASQHNQDKKIVSPGPYLGPGFSEVDCHKALQASPLPYTRHPEVIALAARLLEKGFILAWFQGRMEFGPRALGNRSILADPRKVETRDRVNRIKGRELWRPLAPSILAHKVEEWFLEPGASPYMSFVKTVRPDKAGEIPACVHVDGTARLQTVCQETNPRYFALISRFEQLTGVPVVLNTSFNHRAEPIVCTPRDAVNSFAKMDLDFLIMGDFIAAKQSARLDIVARIQSQSAEI